MDKETRVLAIRIANQLSKEVDFELAKRLSDLANSSSSQDEFIASGRKLADLDSTFLSQIYNTRGKNEPDRLVNQQVDKNKRELSSAAQARLAEVRRRREEAKSATPVTNPTTVVSTTLETGTESSKRKFEFEDKSERQESNGRLRKWRNRPADKSLQHEAPPKTAEELEQEKAMNESLDRDWYDADELGHAAGDELHNPFYDQYSYDPEADEIMEEKAQKKLSSRMLKQKDNDLWEKSRLHGSGMSSRDVDLDADNDDEESRVHLFVHSLVPPFLDGRQVFTQQKNPVLAVRNPDSDMAQHARKGSQLVRDRRQQKERKRQARLAASMAGTALGNVLGVKEEVETEEPIETVSKDTSSVKVKPKLSMKDQRRQLPAFAVKEDLLRTIRENQVTIVIGETGSGKTTQLTQFLYEAGYGDRGLIGCTQPRRVAAMSVAKRVSEEMGVTLGEEVGYAIRFEDITSPKTKIKYLTDGILLREALSSDGLGKYSCIIMDEAHERALNTDVLLGLFKKILASRLDLKLIVTSATMNAERFSQFYGGAPQFVIPGRTFPVEVVNYESTPTDYVDAAVRQVLQIHLSKGPGDILVFMTGQEDIESTCDVLQERLDQLDSPDPLLILPIYSQLPADMQAKIFDPAPKGTRKVVVATNVAETSLTVDGITFVVDTGYAKVKVFNPKLNMDALQAIPISLANASQRSGRAGRTAKGIAYRLYTETAQFEEMYPQAIPEIQRSNLANTILTLKNLGIHDLVKFPFIDPPPMDTMSASLYDLWALGAIDNVGRLTKEGQRMSEFPTEPSLSKLLVKSVEFGCSEEILTIVAMLSVSAVFYSPRERMEEVIATREKFFVAESDHLTLLNVYNQWLSNKRSEAWCTRHFLVSKQLRRAQEIREQLAAVFVKQRASLESTRDWDVVRKCVCAGFFHHAAKAKGSGKYYNLRTGVISKLHYTSALNGLAFIPECVVYHELVLTTSQYVSNVTAVDPKWLAELGGVFYSIKEKGVSGQRQATETALTSKMRIEAAIEQDRVKYEKQQVEDRERQTRTKKAKKSAVILPGRIGGRRRGI